MRLQKLLRFGQGAEEEKEIGEIFSYINCAKEEFHGKIPKIDRFCGHHQGEVEEFRGAKKSEVRKCADVLIKNANPCNLYRRLKFYQANGRPTRHTIA